MWNFQLIFLHFADLLFFLFFFLCPLVFLIFQLSQGKSKSHGHSDGVKEQHCKRETVQKHTIKSVKLVTKMVNELKKTEITIPLLTAQGFFIINPNNHRIMSSSLYSLTEEKEGKKRMKRKNYMIFH